MVYSQNMANGFNVPVETAKPTSSNIQAYPPPIDNNHKTKNYSAYPPPVITVNPVIKPTIQPNPPDHIMAISSNGDIAEINQNDSRLSSKVISKNGSKYVLPTFPQSQNNPSILRVIGNDDRFQIHDTTATPWATVVKIEGQFSSTKYFACTGWMLGPSTVITAGHCIYDFLELGVFSYNVKISPAYNSEALIPYPFGSCLGLQGWVLTPWLYGGDLGYDYGVYKLGCRVGILTGNLGFKEISGDGVGLPVELSGYPGSKGGTTMWASRGSITSSDGNSFFFDNDTSAGQSGAPVWDYLDPECGYCVVAINASEFVPPIMNQGPRVNNTAINFMLGWQQFVALQIYIPIVSK
jgi:glutamyl endopeptidase